MNLEKLLREFVALIADGTLKEDIYNEFSLQHELGIFLRAKLSDYKVQFERNTSFFEIGGTIKHEIDIVIYNDNEKHAIELKYPRQGQYPEQMFSFVKDIKFVEQLRNHGFDSTYCLTLVDDRLFYEGPTQDGIYSYFRGATPINGLVRQPTGQKKESYQICGSYSINWEKCGGQMKYYIVKASSIA